jgi:hypothetical protein
MFIYKTSKNCSWCSVTSDRCITGLNNFWKKSNSCDVQKRTLNLQQIRNNAENSLKGVILTYQCIKKFVMFIIRIGSVQKVQ